MKWLKKVLIFIVSFLVYHVGFGCNAFPVDENNVLQAPAWYPILGIVLSIASTLIFGNLGQTLKKIDESIDYIDPLGTRKHIPDKKVDALYEKAISIVLETNNASMSMLQRRLNISFENAKRLIDRMEQDDIIGSFDGRTPRKIFAKGSQQGRLSTSTIDIDRIIREEAEWRRIQQRPSLIEYELEKVDGMDGYSFEYWCAELLKKNSFVNVEVTQGSGDQGVDILAIKDGIKYAIQCKCYSSDLGNKPIQEINAGRIIYHCQIGAVMTNRYFTPGGKEAATATGVLLWDRDKLEEMLKHSLGDAP